VQAVELAVVQAPKDVLDTIPAEAEVEHPAPAEEPLPS
jgi:hypothetical protein